MMLYPGGQPMKKREGLTDAQRAYLAEIRAARSRTYNGRARRPLEALAARGLVTLTCYMLPQAKGNGMELVQRITAVIREEGER
jgi:hypothetical protein